MKNVNLYFVIFGAENNRLLSLLSGGEVEVLNFDTTQETLGHVFDVRANIQNQGANCTLWFWTPKNKEVNASLFEEVISFEKEFATRQRVTPFALEALRTSVAGGRCGWSQKVLLNLVQKYAEKKKVQVTAPSTPTTPKRGRNHKGQFVKA